MAKIYCSINSMDQGRTEAMKTALNYRPGWKAFAYHSPEIDLGCLEHPRKEAGDFWLETNDFVVALDGEILDFRIVTQAKTMAAKALEVYLSEAEKCVEYFNGNFTLLIWDKNCKTLFIANDRLGLRPFYYYYRGNQFLFASEPKAILAVPGVPKEINWQAVVDLLTYEYILGNQTLVNQVVLVPYASTALIAARDPRIHFHRYWDVRFPEAGLNELTESYLWDFRKAIQKAVDRTLQGGLRVGLPISGGLDSRIIGVEMKDKVLPLHTFTFGERGNEDVKIGKQLASLWKAKHHYAGIKHRSLQELMEKGVFFCDGQVSCNCYPQMNMMDEMEQFVDVGLDGFVGGVLPRAMYSHCAGKDSDFVFKAWDTIKIDERRRVIAKQFYPALQEAQERFGELFNRSKEQSPNNPIDYLNLTQRQRRYINLGKVITRNYLEFRMPFADYDYMDFCLAMPRRFKQGSRICKELLIKFFPREAQLIEAEKGPVFPDRVRSALYWRMQVLKDKLGIKTTPVFDFNLYYRSYLKDFVSQTLLNEDFKGISFFDHDEIRKILNEHFTGQAQHTSIIGGLLTFALWHRTFISGAQVQSRQYANS